MRRDVVLALIAWALLAPKAKAQSIDLILPAAASFSGANGSVWKTDVFATNYDTKAQTLDFYFTNNGLPAQPNLTLTLNAGESKTLADIVQNSFHKPGESGEIAIDVHENPSKIQLTSSVYNLQNDGGTAGSTFAAIPINELLSSTNASLAATNDTVAFRDNVGFVTADQPVTLNATLRDQFGAVQATTTRTLGPYSRLQLSIAGFFGVQPKNGSMIDATASGTHWQLYLASNDNKSNSPVATLGVPINRSGSVQFLPGAGHTSGANGTQWQTDLTLLNTTDKGQGVAITYLPANTDNLSKTPIFLTLRPRETTTLSDIVLSQFTQASSVGALRIQTFDASVVATSRTYNNATTGTYGVGFTATAGTQNGYSTDAGNVAVNAITQNDTTRTNLGLLNMSIDPAPLTVDLYRPNGVTLGTITETIPPLGNKQYNSIARQFTTENIDGAYAIIRPTNLQNILAYASATNSITGQSVLANGMKLAKDTKVTGEQYVNTYLELLKNSRIYLNAKESECLLQGNCNTADYALAVATPLQEAYSSSWASPQALASDLKNWSDGNLSNGELFENDPIGLINTGTPLNMHFLMKPNGGAIPFNLNQTQILREYDTIKAFLIEYVSTHPEAYGGTTATGPAMSFDPTWRTRN